MFCQAPTPGQEWTSPTASEWELSRDALNVSILPMDMLSEEIALTEKSCWETSSSLESLAKSCLDFTFTSGLQHVVTVEPPLTDPCDIAHIPKRCSPEIKNVAIWMLSSCQFVVDVIQGNICDIF